MQPIRILSVDDEKDVESLLVQSFRRQIREGHFQFDFAYDGASALESVAAGGAPYDVILLDINMPVMDGMTFLARLADVQQDARVVMVSAYGDMSNIRLSMNRGAYDFVTKPVDMADLEATIRKTAAEVRKYRRLEDEKSRLDRARGNLARYFSPQLASYLAVQDEPLGPVRRQDVTVLFADLVGFTSLAEASPPEAVIDLLRSFHERMSAIVFHHSGCLEKYIGDALCCTFGVFDQTPDDSAQAVRCAVAMIDALTEWNRQRADAGEDPLQMGVGLNHGPVVIGDIGSQNAVSFATIGSTVVFASRLQDATRKLGTSIVLSQPMIEALASSTDTALAHMFVDEAEIVPRGATRPMRVFFNKAAYPLT